MLSLYRRHTQDCRGSHPYRSQSYESDELRPKWKKCSCPITASGTVRGKQKRQSTGEWDWQRAKEKASVWEAQGWDDTPPPGAGGRGPVVSATVEDAGDSQGKPLRTALEIWLREYNGHTRRMHGYYARRLERFAEFIGLRGVKAFQPHHLREFRDSLTIEGNTAKAHARRLGVPVSELPPIPLSRNSEKVIMSAIGCFFEFCVTSEWIESNPVRKVRRPRSPRDDGKQKRPFSEAEMTRILQACDKLQPTVDSYTGADVRDFVTVAVRTGLRICDLVSLRGSNVEGGNLRLVAKKNKKAVSLRVDDQLAELIARRSGELDNLVFGGSTTDNLDSRTALWRTRVGKVFALAGPWPAAEKPTPHRFRHTFARRLLQEGISTARVARALGDTEATVIGHYSTWVAELQGQLDKDMDRVNRKYATQVDRKLEPIGQRLRRG